MLGMRQLAWARLMALAACALDKTCRLHGQLRTKRCRPLGHSHIQQRQQEPVCPASKLPDPVTEQRQLVKVRQKSSFTTHLLVVRHIVPLAPQQVGEPVASARQSALRHLHEPRALAAGTKDMLRCL